ncbi:hypothetical protein SISSUDRAFT_1051316 [Sistotremastrum suecicum HHB10207 ss-3]|uniref:Uncharacterized protein n=1 Tax=Sistotremastrum suecicum HHB10207 ss-3 TaxID=1314776 RepID=A0A166ANI1_9AGAM|nr:hypothetical protein SISSUDRAFT_1051316 [Sistotremastrum suecicum HHB10207 ss-3]
MKHPEIDPVLNQKMRFSTAIICSALYLGAIVLTTPLPQNSATATVCHEQETTCLAGAFSQATCAQELQACLAATGNTSGSASASDTSGTASTLKANDDDRGKSLAQGLIRRSK